MNRIFALLLFACSSTVFSQDQLPACEDAAAGLVDIPGLGTPMFEFDPAVSVEGQAVHLSARNWLKELIVWEESQTAFVEERIDVHLYYRIPSGPEEIAPESFDIYLGSLPVGQYPVRVVLGTQGTASNGGPVEPSDCIVAEKILSVIAAPDTPLRYYRNFGDTPAQTAARSPRSVSGSWYNPAESGWGLTLVESPSRDMVSGVLFAYDVEKSPTWVLMSGAGWVSPWEVKFDLYRFSGGGLVEQYSLPAPSLVGHASLHFDSATQGILRGEWDGTTFESAVRLLAR